MGSDVGNATPAAVSGAPSLWWPFVLSCVSGLSTVLGAVLVLLRARLTSAPLSSSHLAFTAGLACSVMAVVSVGQMLLPAAFTSPHRIGPLAALSICAVSAALCLAAIRHAPVDRLLALMGMSSTALLTPANAASPPFTPPRTPSHGSPTSASAASAAFSRPSSPTRPSMAAAMKEQSRSSLFGLPTVSQRLAVSNGSDSAGEDDTALEVEGDCETASGGGGGPTGSGDASDGSAGTGDRIKDDVRLVIGGGSYATNALRPSYPPSYPPLYQPSPSHSSLLRPSVTPPPSSLSTLRLGVLTALLLALHNLPEGLAVFVSSFDDEQAGLSMALALSAHNIPEVNQHTHSVTDLIIRLLNAHPIAPVQQG